MDRLSEILESTTEEVERVCETRNRDRNSPSQAGGTVWRADPALRHNIRQLKVISEGLGAQCTKLSLLSLRSPSSEPFDSLAEEIAPQIEGYSRQYTNFTRCSVSLGLLLIISKNIRTFLKTMSGLVKMIKGGQYSETPGVVGVAHETAEAIKKLPESNRVAYRRHLMEKVGSINDTIGEFQVHVDKYKAKYGNNPQQEEQAGDANRNEDEGEDEEGEYTAEEVVVAEKVLSLLTFSQKVVKGSLIILTSVADELHPVADEEGTEEPVPASVFTSVNASSEQRACQEWVGAVVLSANLIERSAVCVGAELYSPLENPDDVRSHYRACLQESISCLDLLGSRQNYVAMLSDSCRRQLDELQTDRLGFSLDDVRL